MFPQPGTSFFAVELLVPLLFCVCIHVCDCVTYKVHARVRRMPLRCDRIWLQVTVDLGKRVLFAAGCGLSAEAPGSWSSSTPVLRLTSDLMCLFPLVWWQSLDAWEVGLSGYIQEFLKKLVWLSKVGVR